MQCTDDALEKDLLDRFIRYVKIETTSDRHSDETPSTPGQWTLLRMLEQELGELGVRDVETTGNGFLVARIPASPGYENTPTIGFMAHVDTSSAVSGAGVEPIVHDPYDGNSIELGEGVTIDPAEDGVIGRYTGRAVITASGNTLLGADDKAGIAEIISAARCLIGRDAPNHGALELIFTPDEETGKGMGRFPVDILKSTCCYTLDGSEEGTIETECFNAYKIDLEFHGISMHPGTARGKLVNAVTMLGHFISLLPRNESPEGTDGRFGFYLPLEVNGDAEQCSCTVYLRDFETEEIDRRRESLKAYAHAVEAAFPGGGIEVYETKQYANMRSFLDGDPRIVDFLKDAIRKTGIEPILKPIRGGTDGARLSEMGIPTPNIFTGGHNYHSKREWTAIPPMIRAVRTICNLTEIWSRNSSR